MLSTQMIMGQRSESGLLVSQSAHIVDVFVDNVKEDCIYLLWFAIRSKLEEAALRTFSRVLHFEET